MLFKLWITLKTSRSVTRHSNSSGYVILKEYVRCVLTISCEGLMTFSLCVRASLKDMVPPIAFFVLKNALWEVNTVNVHKKCTYQWKCTNRHTTELQSALYLQSFYLVWNPGISCQLINTFCSYHCTGGRGLVGSSFEIIIGMAQQWFICSQIKILIWFLFYLSTSKHTQSACKRL